MVEVDVRITRDGRAVLMHDSEISRTTDGRGRVEEMTSDEIREINVSGGLAERAFVPTLDEAVSSARGFGKRGSC